MTSALLRFLSASSLSLILTYVIMTLNRMRTQQIPLQLEWLVQSMITSAAGMLVCVASAASSIFSTYVINWLLYISTLYFLLFTTKFAYSTFCKKANLFFIAAIRLIFEACCFFIIIDLFLIRMGASYKSRAFNVYSFVYEMKSLIFIICACVSIIYCCVSMVGLKGKAKYRASVVVQKIAAAVLPVLHLVIYYQCFPSLQHGIALYILVFLACVSTSFYNATFEGGRFLTK